MPLGPPLPELVLLMAHPATLFFAVVSFVPCAVIMGERSEGSPQSLDTMASADMRLMRSIHGDHLKMPPSVACSRRSDPSAE